MLCGLFTGFILHLLKKYTGKAKNNVFVRSFIYKRDDFSNLLADKLMLKGMNTNHRPRNFKLQVKSAEYLTFFRVKGIVNIH